MVIIEYERERAPGATHLISLITVRTWLERADFKFGSRSPSSEVLRPVVMQPFELALLHDDTSTP